MNWVGWALFTACSTSGLDYATSANACGTCPDTGDCAELCDVVEVYTQGATSPATSSSTDGAATSSSTPASTSAGGTVSSSTSTSEPLEADSCDEASSRAPLADGVYEGSTRGYTDDLNPVGVCLISSAAGPDVFYPLEIGPQEVLEVEATGEDPVVYVVTDCDDEASCVAGTASTSSLVWFNPWVDATQSVVLVVDGDASGGDYTLDITRYPLVDRIPIVPADQCSDVLPSQTLKTGSHILEGDLSGFDNDMSPTPTCTGYAAQGADAFIPFRLETGETLTAYYRQEEGDGSLYYLDLCADSGSCIVGVDNTLDGQVETLSISNPGGGSLEGTLVLDNYKPPGGAITGGLFQLDVVIE